MSVLDLAARGVLLVVDLGVALDLVVVLGIVDLLGALIAEIAQTGTGQGTVPGFSASQPPGQGQKAGPVTLYL